MSKFTGNFIQEPWLFDNEFFRVSPREARSMDPQQRILLQTSYHALESSGYVPFSTPTFDPTTFGTYIGVATNDYVQNLNKKIDVYYSTGTHVVIDVPNAMYETFQSRYPTSVPQRQNIVCDGI